MGAYWFAPWASGTPAAPVNSADHQNQESLAKVNRLVLLRQRAHLGENSGASCGSLLCGIRGLFVIFIVPAKLRVEGTITRC